MGRIARTLDALGGIASTSELRVAGITLESLYGAVRRGEIVRPRKGWYASAGLPAEAVQAWRVGGRIACFSAARMHGLWVPEFEGLHLEVPIEATRLRMPTDRRVRLSSIDEPGTAVHWATHPSPGTRVSVSVRGAIRQVFECGGEDAGFVVLESALNLARLEDPEVRALIESLPQRSRSQADRASARSDSGGESELKLILLGLGIPFRQQVVCARKWPVDFLLGEHLALEADSKAHHASPYRDRRKDAELSEAGIRVLRFMYSQIHHERPAVERAILAAIVRGDADFA